MSKSYSIPILGYMRLPQIIGDPKAEPPIPAIIPVSKSTWYAGIKAGRYPSPIKLSARVSAWKAEEIRDLCDNTLKISEGKQHVSTLNNEQPIVFTSDEQRVSRREE